MNEVQTLLEEIGAYVDQDTEIPNDPDLTVRIKYLDKAQQEWSGAYTWEELRAKGTLSTHSGSSFGLPNNFRTLMSPVYDLATDIPNEYPKLEKPADRYKKESTDKYCYIIGDTLHLNPPAASGASLCFDYQKYPTSLVTLNQKPSCPRTDYLVKRGIAYVLESRSDERFPQVKVDADTMLARMIEEQDVPTGGLNRIPDWQRSDGFRLGT